MDTLSPSSVPGMQPNALLTLGWCSITQQRTRPSLDFLTDRDPWNCGLQSKKLSDVCKSILTKLEKTSKENSTT